MRYGLRYGRLFPGDVRYSEECSSAEKSSAKPLSTSRGSYLPLFHASDLASIVDTIDSTYVMMIDGCVVVLAYYLVTVAGTQHFSVSANEIEDRIRYATVGNIKDVKASWKITERSRYPPLVVRALSRSRVHYYGKPNKKGKWPYQVKKSSNQTF